MMKLKRSAGILRFLLVLSICVVPAVFVFGMFAKEARVRQGLGRGGANAGPVIRTDKESYLAGETITISGAGFAAGESVMLQVKHTDGTVESGMGHEPWWVYAGADGTINATWALDAHDTAGINLAIEAAGSSGANAQTGFARTAAFIANPFSNRREDKTRVTAAGFDPNELVTIRVKGGHSQEAVSAMSDGNGRVAVDLDLRRDASAGPLTVEAESSLTGLSVIAAADIFSDSGFFSIVDNALGANGAPCAPPAAIGCKDDVPLEKDLTQLGRNDSDPSKYKIYLSWNSVTSWTGTGQTGNACALFDTGGDGGKIDFAICVSVRNDPADSSHVIQSVGSPYAFNCAPGNAGARKIDRCAQPSNPLIFDTTAVRAGVFANVASSTGNLVTFTDPFPTSPGDLDHPNRDTTIEVDILKAGQEKSILPANASLANVCSYPSAGNGGNNNPFDCILKPGSGLLQIVKNSKTDVGTFEFTVKDSQNNAVVPNPTITTTADVDADGAFITQLLNPLALDVGANGTATYTLAELSQSGWNLTDAKCFYEGDTASHDPRTESITITSAKVTTCTFTNTSQAAHLTIIKRVINDNGGTAGVGAFGISTTAGALKFGTGVVVGTITTYTSDPLTTSAGSKTLHESNVAGYTEGSWSCTGAAGAVNTNFDTGSVVLANGESVTCTITNDDNAASLTIVKRIVNDNGGAKVASDFGITAAGGALTFGAGVADGQDTLKYTATTLTGLSAGSKSLHENPVTGYTEGTWGCVGAAGAVNGDAQSGSVVLANGESVTCTITNDDNAASLTIVKNVVNGHGGTKTVADFGITTSAGTLAFGDGVTAGTTTTYTSTALTVSAGSKTLHENAVDGYTEGTWSCTSGLTNDNAQSGSVTLANGDSVTCTITNDDVKAVTTATTAQNVLLNDKLTINNFRTGASDAGVNKVSFKLYSGETCSTQIGDTNGENVTPTSAGVASTVNGVYAPGPGTYSWIVTWAGDQNNEGFSTVCGVEVTTIKNE